MSRDYVVNAWDVACRLDSPVVLLASGLRFVRIDPATGNKTQEAWKSFDEVEAAFPHVTEWATATGSRYVAGVWFPASDVPTGDAVPRFESGKKVKFTSGIPCEARQSGDWESRICGRAARGDDTARIIGGREVPACGVHAAAQQRSDANAAKHRARFEQARERSEQRRNMRNASADWAQRLSDEWGLDTEPVDRAELRVATNPETLHAYLTALVNVARDATGLTADEILTLAQEDHQP